MAEGQSSLRKGNHSFDLGIPICSSTILGMGAEANGSFCVFSGNKAHLSRNFGDLSYVENMDAFRAAVVKIMKTTGPIDLVARDMHPQYSNREYAKEVADEAGAELVDVQHHAAHVYSAAVENGIIDDDFCGIACDGTGYGSDGKIWGGEVFLGDKRVGSLEEQMMVGGDSAVMYPLRMLFGILTKFLSRDEIGKLEGFDPAEVSLMSRQAELGFNVFHTTSCGRVLDAVSAMLGFCRKRTYDGEPAIVLEKHAIGAEPFELLPVIKMKDRWILDTTRLFEFLYENRDSDKGRLSATAHHYVASGLFGIASKYKKEIVFSGGVAYNSIIRGILTDKGVKMNVDVACGDYGVSYGQCAYVGIKRGFFDVGTVPKYGW
ncbi:MAG: hypothetical protein V1718_05585 [archaeon]